MGGRRLGPGLRVRAGHAGQSRGRRQEPGLEVRVRGRRLGQCGARVRLRRQDRVRVAG